MKWSAIRRKLRRVDRAIDKSIASAEIPGAVAGARMPKSGETLEYFSERGLAVLQPERIPMARRTIFDLASLTKPIATTTAILLLVDEGAVELDAPVAKYLPLFSERNKEEVTIRHLLTHSSGLKPWRAYHEIFLQKERKTGESWIGTPEARASVIDRTVRSALVHEPGEAAVYGDLDFIVLGAVVEAVVGQRLDDFCRERIFAPFEMTDTFFIPIGRDAQPLPEPTRRRIAATENCPWRNRILWGEVHDPNASVMSGVAGHAGLFSTVDDVLKFARVVIDSWHGRSELLPRETLRPFLTRQSLPLSSDWALGWDTPTEGTSSSGKHFSKNSVGHLGFTGTSLWIDLDRELAIALLTNRVHLIAKKSRFALRPIVHDAIVEAFEAG
ncbi:MAG: beta-lactamase family protein [Deltaproteobacteria bacterium]|nr:beta-lactamase family protein [Deltaproteobacteria bacterium]